MDTCISRNGPRNVLKRSAILTLPEKSNRRIALRNGQIQGRKVEKTEFQNDRGMADRESKFLDVLSLDEKIGVYIVEESKVTW